MLIQKCSKVHVAIVLGTPPVCNFSTFPKIYHKKLSPCWFLCVVDLCRARQLPCLVELYFARKLNTAVSFIGLPGRTTIDGKFG
jgi:hypothetical protein